MLEEREKGPGTTHIGGNGRDRNDDIIISKRQEA